jgi:adenylate cyclase
MGDEQQRRQVFSGVWQFLVSTARHEPLVVVLDDLHWADRSSVDLLGFLLERLSGAPLMLVLAYRPGFDAVERATLHASHTAIRLEPLSAEESLALARGFLGVATLPADLERIVTTRAEGNPFFIEELLQALLELGSLAVVDGRAVLARVEVDIPDTVQGTILARIDRLSPADRSVLQHAAVLGRSFSRSLLAEVSGQEDLADRLGELARSQLLVSVGPDEWTFKHALIQEVAYEALLVRQRRELHRKAAQALEAQTEDDPARLELLAQHYEQAGDLDRARTYGVRAGDLASERMGFVEAMERYRAALRLWASGDETGRLELLEKLGRAALMAGDHGTARTALTEAEAGWRSRGEPARRAAPLVTLIRAHWVAGDIERSGAALREAIELLEPMGPSPELVRAYVWGSTLKMLVAESDEAVELARRGLELADAMGLPAARANLLNNLGVCESRLGDAAGIERLRQALELAEETGDPEAIGRGYVNLPSTLIDYFDLNRDAVEACRKGRERMRSIGAPSYEWFIAMNEASALLNLGEYDAAEQITREILGPQRGVIAMSGLVDAGITQATVDLHHGRQDEARRVLEEMEPLARRVGDDSLYGILVLRAQLEEAAGNLAAAKLPIREALAEVEANPGRGHWRGTRGGLDVGARILTPDELEPILESVRPYANSPSSRARVLEAEATTDRAKLLEAAALYHSLELPYAEARARVAADDFDAAAEIVERLGVEESPVGRRLRAERARRPRKAKVRVRAAR